MLLPPFIPLVLAIGVASLSTGDTAVAQWEMDEPAGSSIALDSSGTWLHGSIGADVEVGVTDGDTTAYRFPDIAPNSGPVRPGHMVALPGSALLDPGDADFRVTIRFRTSSTPANLVQKGQSGTGEGLWKIELDKGRVRCVFSGEGGVGLSVAAKEAVDDGEWHTVACERTAAGVTVDLDGEQRTKDGPTGRIANDVAVVVGGKRTCNQQSVGCDYFSGDIDFIRVER